MKYLLLCSALIVSQLAPAQVVNSIYGKTTQKGTGAAIPNASVFISGSSLGTVSDSAGNFELRGIPSGNFELIISSVGFSTVVYPFTSDKLPLKLNVQMEPKVEELNSITVEPFDPNGWENWGRLFLENFIGTSSAGRRCTITNTSALRFRYNRKTRTLTVVADQPLEILNSHLGYTLQYQLEEFTLNQQENSVLFVGYTLFREMNRPARYYQRRRDVYNGSMNHFMRSLYHDSLAEEGFETRRLVRTPNYEKQRVRQIMASQARRNINSGGKTVMRLGVAPPADSTTYYQRVMQQPEELSHVSSYVLGPDSLLTAGRDSAKILSFNNFLQITYKNGLEEREYLLYRMLGRKPWYPVSLIFLISEDGILVEPNGYHYPPQAIFSMEYWGWSEKVAHMLPIDYDPRAKR